MLDALAGRDGERQMEAAGAAVVGPERRDGAGRSARAHAERTPQLLFGRFQLVGDESTVRRVAAVPRVYPRVEEVAAGSAGQREVVVHAWGHFRIGAPVQLLPGRRVEGHRGG